MPANPSENACRVTVSLSQEEADCLLHLLMLAEPNEEFSAATTERLLCRIAEAQRTLNRQKLAHREPPARADNFA